MTMLEKAAMAAGEAVSGVLCTPDRIAAARAVLMAVREPDETMSRAVQSTEGWESMIDAILNEDSTK